MAISKFKAFPHTLIYTGFLSSSTTPMVCHKIFLSVAFSQKKIDKNNYLRKIVINNALVNCKIFKESLELIKLLGQIDNRLDCDDFVRETMEVFGVVDKIVDVG